MQLKLMVQCLLTRKIKLKNGKSIFKKKTPIC